MLTTFFYSPSLPRSFEVGPVLYPAQVNRPLAVARPLKTRLGTFPKS